MIRYVILSIIFLFGGNFLSRAQNNIPIGSWRTHFALQALNNIEFDGNHTIMAGSSSGLVRFDMEDNSFEPLSKLDGFSDIQVTDIKYHAGLKLWIIAYASGNIDILKNDNVITINDIFRSGTITGSKQINEILLYNNEAYLSTDFGIVVLNLAKMEVSETYANIGLNAALLQVHSAAIVNDTIFIASNQGLRAASMSDTVNKIDYRNWKAFTYVSSNRPTKLNTNNNVLYACESSKAYYYTNKTWNELTLGLGSNTISGITQSKGSVFICGGSTLYQIKPDFSFQSFETLSSPTECVADSKGLFWMSDLAASIRSFNSTNGQFSNFQPNSPINQSAFRLKYLNGKIFCTSGGYDQKSAEPTPSANTSINGIYMYEDGIWKNFVPARGNYPNVRASMDICYNKQNKYYYIASFNGLVRFSESSPYTVYNSTNSPIIDYYPPNQYIFNYGVDCDKNGTIWSSYPGEQIVTRPTLLSLTTKGVWTPYNLNIPAAVKTADLFVEPTSSDKWLRSGPDYARGIVVFNEKNPAGMQYRVLNEQSNTGGLTNAKVYCMTLTKNGDMWIGTANGINIISDASSVMKVSSNGNFFAVNASVPIFDSRALLRDKVVTALKTDGGDRKWAATPDGLWLFSPDGSEQLAFFNTDNSPLPSNNILNIEIEGTTGEVFIATDKGVVSYRNDATIGGEKTNNDVKVFPNPVKPAYSGPIAISGLVDQAVVKITDITGILVYQTVANGGTATWSGNNARGQHVAPGVYLIFSSDANGESSLVSKIVVLE